MAKSSSISLAQWIFLLVVIWGAFYFAGVILRDRGGLSALFPPSASREVPSKSGVKRSAPIDEVIERPVRPDLELIERHQGKKVSEIIAEIRAAGPSTSSDPEESEDLRLGGGGEESGIVQFANFPNRAEEAGLVIEANNTLNGSSAVSVFDLDGDGHRDVQAPAEPGGADLQLFRNRADGTFEAVADPTGAGPIPSGNQIVAADFDNDGDLDHFVVRERLPNSLYENRGDRFHEVTSEAGLLEFRWTASAQWVDFDRDGWIDLFVAHNPGDHGNDYPSCGLFHNERDGTFRDLGWESGLRFSAYVRDCGWGDLDGDGYPDLVVSTFEVSGGETDAAEGGENHSPAPLLVLRSIPAEQVENWRFQELGPGTGLEEVDDAGRIVLGDYDQDGALDLLAGGGVWHPLRLFRNEGAIRFAEVSKDLGLEELRGVLSIELADLDGDGFEDLALGTTDQSANRVFLNRGADTFREVTGAGGFGILQGSPALNAGDLDGDGDLELVAAADWTRGALFENPGVEQHAWLTLDLEGTTANRAAVGARVSLIVRDRDWVLHRIERTAREPRLEIGLGEAVRVESLEIEWPVIGWPISRFAEVPLNRSIRIRQGETEFKVMDLKPFRLGGGEVGEEDSDDS